MNFHSDKVVPLLAGVFSYQLGYVSVLHLISLLGFASVGEVVKILCAIVGCLFE